jgi:23S rRNA (adenine2503-C2)-methyltransferase
MESLLPSSLLAFLAASLSLPSPMADLRETLNPLGLTSRQFVEVARGKIVLGRQGGQGGAMLAYKKVFREGVRSLDGRHATVAVTLPSIVKVQREDSPEGEVIKFVSRLTVLKRNASLTTEAQRHREDKTGEENAEGAEVGRGRQRKMSGEEEGRRPQDDDAAPTSLDEGIAARLAEEARSAGGPVVGTGLGRDVSGRFEYLDIESVLIPMIGSLKTTTYTLCVSSQVGCAMGCTFCETAQMGLIRSLTAEEIVAQWYAAVHELKVPVKNIVFMGMGEPLDNIENVIQAVDVLKDHNGAAVPISQITVSTVGRIDGIARLSRQVEEPGWHRLGLALSLNAPNDTVRSSIMPINRKWKMAELQEALLAWPRRSGNKVCIEYVLIPGVNDSRENAREIAEFLRPFGLLTSDRIAGTVVMAILNLIPYNPRRNSPWPAPAEEKVDEFLGWLMEEGVFAKRRRTKGRAMMGACGQLGSEDIRKGQLVQPTVSA